MIIDIRVKYISKDDHSHRQQAAPTSKSEPSTRKKNASNNKLSRRIKKLLKTLQDKDLKWLKDK